MRSKVSSYVLPALLALLPVVGAGCGGEILEEDVSSTSSALNVSGWTPIPAGLFNEAPSLTSRRPGDLVAVGRGLDSSAWISVRDNNGNWNGFSPLPFKMFSSKVVVTARKGVTTGKAELVVAGLGMDGKPWYATKLVGSAQFGQWLPLPGGKTFCCAPAIADGAGGTDIVFPDSAGNLWATNHIAIDITTFPWRQWEQIYIGTGRVLGEVAMWTNSLGDVMLVGRERDNFYNFTERRFLENRWNGLWKRISHHAFNSAPAIAGWSDTHVVISGLYSSQASGTLVNYVYSPDRGNTWQRSINMPTKSFVSAPSMWSWGPNHFDTAALAPDQMYHLNTIDL